MNNLAAKKKLINAWMEPVTTELDKYVVRDEEQANAIIDYTIKLFSKNKRWKTARLVRKVVEYFKLKPKHEDATN